MTKKDIIQKLIEAKENTKLANVYFRFSPYYYNLIPLIISEKLVYVIKEDDFIFDGFTIFRLKDITKVKIKNDFCDEIIKKEGLMSKIQIPSVDITIWKTVFESLKAFDRNIIVEKQTIDDKGAEFVIGRIDKIYKQFAYVWHFDADGIWGDSPVRVPYSEITTITFGSRYVDMFSKYITEPPK